MKYQIKTLPDFDRELKRLSKKYKSLKKDVLALAELIESNPSLGIPLGDNLYKIRLAITSKGKGKSGGARVITCLRILEDSVYLVYIYDKSEIDNISEKKLEDLAKKFR